MNAYIEIESLRSLISQRNDERYDECKRMLKRNLCLSFSFSKEEALADPIIKNWVLQELTSGTLAPKPKWDSAFPAQDEELSIKRISGIEKLCAVYLLDDESPQHLSNAILLSHCGHELETLSKLFVIPENGDYDISLGANKIRKWDNIKPYTAPCTDLLFIDRYILSNKRLLRSNFYRIIKTCCSKTSKIPINIVIVVENNSIDSLIKLNEVRDNIKDMVEDLVGYRPFVTFVLCKRRGKDPMFHDRFILTNYRAISSGDSFNYFNEEGKVITAGFGVSIKSLANKYDYINEIINETVIKKIQHELLTAHIEGDKKSNFLKF